MADFALVPVPVEIVELDTGYQLLRGGKPYQIYGAGMDTNEITALAAVGGNSLRTWVIGTDGSDGRQLLDEAAEQGMTVALCLDIERERHGFDYDDEEAVARQLAYAQREVLKYKDHPALLFWIIGNEVNHSYTNPRVFDAVNAISKMIHEIDKNHPTTTALSGFSGEMVAVMVLSVLLLPVLRSGWQIRRWEGAVLLSAYVGAFLFLL